MKEAIIVWKFYDAPEELQKLSNNGGDKDWLVELPPGYEEYGTPSWIESMDSCREPSHYPHPTKAGWKVIIGAHAPLRGHSVRDSLKRLAAKLPPVR